MITWEKSRFRGFMSKAKKKIMWRFEDAYSNHWYSRTDLREMFLFPEGEDLLTIYEVSEATLGRIKDYALLVWSLSLSALVMLFKWDGCGDPELDWAVSYFIVWLVLSSEALQFYLFTRYIAIPFLIIGVDITSVFVIAFSSHIVKVEDRFNEEGRASRKCWFISNILFATALCL